MGRMASFNPSFLLRFALRVDGADSARHGTALLPFSYSALFWLYLPPDYKEAKGEQQRAADVRETRNHSVFSFVFFFSLWRKRHNNRALSSAVCLSFLLLLFLSWQFLNLCSSSSRQV